MNGEQQEPIEASLTPEEANRIIHSHRKVRYGKQSSMESLFPRSLLNLAKGVL